MTSLDSRTGRHLLQRLDTFPDGRYDYCSIGPMPDRAVVGGCRHSQLKGGADRDQQWSTSMIQLCQGCATFQ